MYDKNRTKVRVFVYKGWFAKCGESKICHAVDPFKFRSYKWVTAVEYDTYITAPEPIYDLESLEVYVKLLLNERT